MKTTTLEVTRDFLHYKVGDIITIENTETLEKRYSSMKLTVQPGVEITVSILGDGPVKKVVPTLTTEDGVVLKDGEEAFLVNLSTWSPDAFTVGFLLDNPRRFKDRKIFSTEQEAELFIFLNRPCLSFKDLEDMFDITDRERVTLLCLVKEKLDKK